MASLLSSNSPALSHYEINPSSRFEATTLEIEETCSAPKPKGTKGGETSGSWNNNEREEMGMCLTWKDVWVTASVGKNEMSKSILEGLTGYAKPGQLLAIMGPSGCGKSALLDTLAGMHISK